MAGCAIGFAETPRPFAGYVDVGRWFLAWIAVQSTSLVSERQLGGVFCMATAATVDRRYPGRRFLWLGIALAILGPAAYALQLWSRQLFTPWYVPTLTTLGL